MRLVDVSLPSPEENLALDEALLLECAAALARGEAAATCERLRIWESPSRFVVLGVSGKAAEEVDLAACERDRIPVLRRVSGGGTVLQGPGCLNLALVLSLAQRPELQRVEASYAAILDVTAAALGCAGARRVAGASDLAIGELKVSGSAQKRTRGALLHHLTLLYDFELESIERYLRPPPRQPSYRRGRAHRDFCTNIALAPRRLRRDLAAAWGVEADAAPPALPELDELIRTRYSDAGWNFRF